MKKYNLEDEVINHDKKVLNIIENIFNEEVQNSFYNILKKHEFIRKNIKYIEYLGKQKTMDCQKEMLASLLGITNDYFLQIISNQEDWGLQQQLRIAALEEYIKNDKFRFNLIAIQNDWDNMNVMRSALDKEYIRNNKYFLETIAQQKDFEAKEALITALGHGLIRNNKNYFDLIVNQKYYLCMLEMLDAILNEDLRKNNKYLIIIDSFKTEAMIQEQARLNLSIKAIRDNLENFYKIMSCKISIQEKIREAYNSNIDFDLDEFISEFTKRLTIV